MGTVSNLSEEHFPHLHSINSENRQNALYRKWWIGVGQCGNIRVEEGRNEAPGREKQKVLIKEVSLKCGS